MPNNYPVVVLETLSVLLMFLMGIGLTSGRKLHFAVLNRLATATNVLTVAVVFAVFLMIVITALKLFF